jgi:hypothetical protein
MQKPLPTRAAAAVLASQQQSSLISQHNKTSHSWLIHNSNPHRSHAQVGAFQVLILGRAADAAHAPLSALRPFSPFRDASCGAPCFHLHVLDCLRGLEKAARAGFLAARDGAWRFDVQEYEHYEQVGRWGRRRFGGRSKPVKAASSTYMRIFRPLPLHAIHATTHRHPRWRTAT